ncbi:MAG: 50S ribosomal protein L32 [Candidatus Harrisonbacteria bacterium CG10_big_fil_rev_8_21_14_0_10_42_17]|uniref:Large ribosomal subunit protein bL32 n=1 Tax=Candidatus Harrisonbacteria bacterium CG10_big_fil_rev_8_21_14_0_10_42_17 TaxID=1974584 RepID=A0A2M6WGW9_9BACT|nr:MAG: 50S ribosomal protein L32 [Candidatus Harrisonbacteria bacterium CG10_big_fil_rev_8_21_14_0_10_42_17]
MVPKKRHSKSKVGRRRSHLALKGVVLSTCTNCKGPITGHRACAQCGAYKGKIRARVKS